MAEFDPLNPFDAAQKAEINKAIKELTTLIQGINKAQSAGIDNSELLARATETRDRLTRLKQTYFPNE